MKIEIETWDAPEQRGAEKLRDRIVGLNLIAELIILPNGIRDKRNAILQQNSSFSQTVYEINATRYSTSVSGSRTQMAPSVILLLMIDLPADRRHA